MTGPAGAAQPLPGSARPSVDAGGPPEGLLIVVSAHDGPAGARLAAAMSRLLAPAVVLQGSTLAQMVVERPDDERPAAADGELAEIRARLLRYCGQLALADTYRGAGYDVLVVEELADERLDDFCDLAEPDTVHLIVLDAPDAVGPGLRLRSSALAVEELAARAVAGLAEALLPAES